MPPRIGAVGHKLTQTMGLVVTLIFSVVLLPTVVDTINDINTTGWDFTGYAGAIVLMDLIPFIWIAGLVITTVLSALGKV